jgi:hypothetical protein
MRRELTRQEAENLRTGDIVQTKVAGRWTPVVVLSWEKRPLLGGNTLWFTVRRLHPLIGVHTTPRMNRWQYELRVDGLDAVTSNAFSDWLDERGEHRAATMLREAFPLVRADGSNGVTGKEDRR